MPAEIILQQQTFQQTCGTTKDRHSQRRIVAMLIQDEQGTFRVDVLECPLGLDGLPSFVEGTYVERGERVATRDMAEAYFSYFQQRSIENDWMLVDAGTTLEFNCLEMLATGEPAFSYTFDATALDRAREHLADLLDNRLVSNFLETMSKQDSSIHWTHYARTSNMPILVSLALVGIGTLHRNYVALAPGQLRTMGMYSAADFWMEPLYRMLQLRSGRWNFAEAIGLKASALVF